MTMNVGYDRTQFVRKAVTEVKETLAIAVGLVVLIIFLFFREWTIALRPLIDIPVSLIGAFFIMYIAGFSINVLTLLAIVLATGLVVDDGIVVTENIFKKMVISRKKLMQKKILYDKLSMLSELILESRLITFNMQQIAF